jgi:hypothetical protein
MKRLFVASLVLGGCTGSSKQHAGLGTLAFDVPADWQRADSTTRGVVTSVWTPPPGDNARKESVTVIYTELSPAVAKAGPSTVAQLLTQAQASLHGRLSQPASVTTRHGFVGARVDVDFVPPGRHETYHRVHAAFVDGGGLVHVIYTAEKPDVGLAAFDEVLATMHRGEG